MQDLLFGDSQPLRQFRQQIARVYQRPNRVVDSRLRGGSLDQVGELRLRQMDLPMPRGIHTATPAAIVTEVEVTTLQIPTAGLPWPQGLALPKVDQRLL